MHIPLKPILLFKKRSQVIQFLSLYNDTFIIGLWEKLRKLARLRCFVITTNGTDCLNEQCKAAGHNF